MMATGCIQQRLVVADVSCWQEVLRLPVYGGRGKELLMADEFLMAKGGVDGFRRQERC